MANDFYQKWLGGSFSALNETNMTGRVATYLSDLLPKNVKGFLQMNATEEIQKYDSPWEVTKHQDFWRIYCTLLHRGLVYC